MIVKHKYNGKEYTLSNENLEVGDKVYSISKGVVKDGKHVHENFDFRNVVSGWKSEPHIILDLHYSNYPPYNVHTDHGFGCAEQYFKIINVQLIKPQPPAGMSTTNAMALAYQQEKLRRMQEEEPLKFLYYNERKIK